MARIVYATALITIVTTLAGCPGGGAYVEPNPVMPTNIYIPPGADETDLVEEMAISRDAYEKGLQQLVAYYSRSGNNMKLDMAEKELRSFTTMLKYKYLLGPVAGGQATTPFAEADRLFYDAQALEKQGRPSGTRLITDKNKLRLALQKYDQLMRNYPSSDKVDEPSRSIMRPSRSMPRLTDTGSGRTSPSRGSERFRNSTRARIDPGDSFSEGFSITQSRACPNVRPVFFCAIRCCRNSRRKSPIT
ncbi:MAG: hypothetical protein ACYTE3_32280 [Planctomycetota bacterium]|jgi:hypothetical protein